LVSKEARDAIEEYLNAQDPYSTYYMRLYEEKIKPYEIEDPYGSDIDEYRKAARKLWQYCCRIADLIKDGNFPTKS
jgi:protein-tyrosine-phosphatase